MLHHARCTYIHVYTHTHICVWKWVSYTRQFACQSTMLCTGWRRLIGCLNLQVIRHKRATNNRAFLLKMTYEDKAPYASTPPCMPCVLSQVFETIWPRRWIYKKNHHRRRRVLLSGTPMQNDLEEFFSMVDFTNPGPFLFPSSSIRFPLSQSVFLGWNSFSKLLVRHWNFGWIRVLSACLGTPFALSAFDLTGCVVRTKMGWAGVLGDVKQFRKVYQSPILHGREPDATEKVLVCALRGYNSGSFVRKYGRICIYEWVVDVDGLVDVDVDGCVCNIYVCM